MCRLVAHFKKITQHEYILHQQDEESEEVRWIG